MEGNEENGREWKVEGVPMKIPDMEDVQGEIRHKEDNFIKGGAENVDIFKSNEDNLGRPKIKVNECAEAVDKTSNEADIKIESKGDPYNKEPLIATTEVIMERPGSVEIEDHNADIQGIPMRDLSTIVTELELGKRGAMKETGFVNKQLIISFEEETNLEKVRF